MEFPYSRDLHSDLSIFLANDSRKLYILVDQRRRSRDLGPEFTVFEVEWASVRGMSYLNELQNDTSLAIETKSMKRWDFDSIAQAAGRISSWFSGKPPELLHLNKYLDFLAQKEKEKRKKNKYYDAGEDMLTGDDNRTHNKDVLILFRFNDHDLPFKLREVIVSDQRLLTLLKAGLPSWVIFLQSYPVFCNLYRPWMCPLARILYVLISVVTVIIGFYDLYKNVPVLKAAASRLCGPLIDWIETWEMVSRIKYLGTMLFLHNIQKAVKWCLAFTRTIMSFSSVLIQPLAEPLVGLFGFLLPRWNSLYDLVENIGSVVWIGIETSYNFVGDVLELLLWPLWSILTLLRSIATSMLYPIFWALWEIIYTPIRLVLAILSFVRFICTSIYNIVGETWQFVSSFFKVPSPPEPTPSACTASTSSSHISKICGAFRSIRNGFVTLERYGRSFCNDVLEFIRCRRQGSGEEKLREEEKRKSILSPKRKKKKQRKNT